MISRFRTRWAFKPRSVTSYNGITDYLSNNLTSDSASSTIRSSSAGSTPRAAQLVNFRFGALHDSAFRAQLWATSCSTALPRMLFKYHTAIGWQTDGSYSLTTHTRCARGSIFSTTIPRAISFASAVSHQILNHRGANFPGARHDRR